MKWLQTYFNKMKGGKRSPSKAPNHEIFWSAIGSFFGIYSIYAIAHFGTFNFEDTLFLLGSFGASAVLIYGVPKSPYAQPRNLVFGHVISAVVGVTCALFISNAVLAAAMAVSLAIIVMHLMRSIHPPGGATALIAVIGSEHIHQMLYWYVLSPVLIGALIMLIVALIVNNISPHRRYPEYWL